MVRNSVTVICTALLLGACTAYSGPDVFTGTALGAVNHDVEVGVEGGSFSVDVYSNGSYSIYEDTPHAWVKYPSGATGNDGFSIDVEPNSGVPRLAALTLAMGSHKDTVFIKQHGAVAALFSLEDYGITLPSASGTATVPVSTNIPVADVVLSPGYGTDWISGLEMDASSGISFSYTANGTGFIRKGTILITYTDGWGDETGITLYLTQDGTGAGSRSISFAELRELATTEGTPIDQNLILEGLVAGNTASGNMGDNEQLTTINIDYTVSQRTIYLESKDASKGIRILADVPEDNPFSQGDLLKIDLKGTRLFKSTVLEERDPVYYYIEGFTSSNVTSRIPGGTLPEKKKAIGELTDDDIFTYTTLTQVELPIRKGPLTPLEEFYTNAGENHRCAKFPVLLRGKDGEHLYVFTNTTCPYRRDGSRLPYGSGDLGGIIVHERYTRFSYNDTPNPDTYGYIGRYQIRHTSRSDFRMADSMEEESFSGLLAEWRYVTEKNLTRYPVTGGRDKNAWFTHTYEYGESSSLYGKSCVNLTSDLSYLGPVGTSSSGFFGKNTGNKNGLGVILEDGTDWMGPGFSGLNSSAAASINNSSGNEGKGIVPASAGSAWYVWYNRNANQDAMNNWLISFSTKGISSDVFSVQVSMVNTADGDNYGPRYWYLEYSLTDSTGNGGEDRWTTVERFCVPDRAATQPVTQFWMLPGFKPMDFRLPSSIGSQEHVYVRLRPEAGTIGTKTSYEAVPGSKSTMPWTAINYIGVRYNK